MLSFLNKLLLNKEFINLFIKYLLSSPLLSLNVSIILIKSSKIFSSKEYSLKTSFNYKKKSKKYFLTFSINLKALNKKVVIYLLLLYFISIFFSLSSATYKKALNNRRLFDI